MHKQYFDRVLSTIKLLRIERITRETNIDDPHLQRGHQEATMKKTYRLTLSLLIGLLFSSLAYSDAKNNIGEDRDPPTPLEHVTLGYETESIELNRGLNGKVHSIEARECPTCALNKYKVTAASKAYISSQAVPFDELTKYNGKSGAVSYYPETNELHHLRYFNLEATK
ncbi:MULTISPECIES: hypothetical protein [unclassified Oleiphilus]|nr:MULTISPECIES: hypothetical protein [unclassified Oleiphilus]